MKKVLFMIATAVVTLASCGGAGSPAAEPAAEPATEEAVTATDSVAVSYMSRCIPGTISHYIRTEGKMEGVVYKISEADGKVDVYSDWTISLDSAYATPGYKEDAKPEMKFSYSQNSDFVDITPLPITEASKTNMLTFVQNGKPGDKLTVRFKGQITADEYAKLSERQSVNYIGFYFLDPEEAAKEEAK